MNMVIAQLWLFLGTIAARPHFVRVESKANIADGPSRGDLVLMEQLNARFVVPALPSWLCDIYAFGDVHRPSANP